MYRWPWLFINKIFSENWDIYSLKKESFLLCQSLNYSICTMPHHVTIKSSPDVIKHLYCNHWHHIRVQSTEWWKSLKSWEYYNLWAFDIKGNLVYKHNIYQRYKIMQHRPHLLCKFYVGLTSKLEKLVMVKFCSLMRLTSVKVLKKHVQIKAIASFVHLHISRIDEIPVHLG